MKSHFAFLMSVCLFTACGGDSGSPSDPPPADAPSTLGQVTGGVVNSRRLGMRYPSAILTVGGRLLVVGNGEERVSIYNNIPTDFQTQADVVIGQKDVYTDARNSGGVSASSLASPQSIASDGTNLYVVDRLNHRVLYFRTIPTTFFAAADAVLGQPDGTSAVANNTPGSPGTPSAQSLYYPTGVAIKNNRLFVVDSFNHRVLIWNTLPTSTQTAADIVVGQASMSTAFPGSSVKSMAYPEDITVTNSQMIVADSGNSRVLIWNAIPTNPSTDQNLPANIVLGQPDSSSKLENNGGVSAVSLSHPIGVFSDGTRLFVSDTKNNRVLIWNQLPSSVQNDQRKAADVVLGQPNMTSNTANNGGVSAHSLNGPQRTFYDGFFVYVADSANNRILTWSTLPSSNQADANRVLGQPDLASSLPMNPGGISGANLSMPRSYALIGTNKVAVADSQTHRVLIWNSRPLGTYPAADLVLGQPAITSYTANNEGVSARSLSNPTSVATDGTKLFVADRDNHRVLIWNSIPTTIDQPADVVLGQPNMSSNVPMNTPGAPGTTSAQSLWFPNAVFVSGTKLIVSDTGECRVLIWSKIPTTNQKAADTVIGQKDLNSRGVNNGGLSGGRMNQPQGLFVMGTQLFITDFGNNRVLIYNKLPTANNKSADVVLGQPDFTSSAINNGGLSAKSLSSPLKAFATSTHLAVADYRNNRVLIWKPVPTTNFAAATAVVGQADLVSAIPNRNGVTDSSLSGPGDVFFDASRFVIIDSGNDRIVDVTAVSVLP